MRGRPLKLPENSRKEASGKRKADVEAWGKVKRPEVIISKHYEGSYVDNIRRINADPGLTNLGDTIRHIRRSQKADLMLEVN